MSVLPAVSKKIGNVLVLMITIPLSIAAFIGVLCAIYSVTGLPGVVIFLALAFYMGWRDERRTKAAAPAAQEPKPQVAQAPPRPAEPVLQSPFVPPPSFSPGPQAEPETIPLPHEPVRPRAAPASVRARSRG